MKRKTILLTSLLVLFFANLSQAQNIALLFKSKEDVEVKKQNSTNFQKGKKGSRFKNGDVLRTGKAGQAALVFTDDKTLMRIWGNSNITIHGKKEDKSIVKRIEMTSGLLFFNVRKRQKTAIRLETPYGVATIKGTSGLARIDEKLKALFLTVFDGIVDLANQFAQSQIVAGQTGKSDGQNIDVQNTQNNNLPAEFQGAQGFSIEFRDAKGAIKNLIIQQEDQEQ